MPGEIISEHRARSNRNGGRHHRGFAGDFPRNPHKPLLNDLVSGRWLPVVGAGMSLNARLPPLKKMPLWLDLGKALAEELTDFVSNGTLDAISAYQHEFGRAKLIERLTDILL